MQSDRVVLGSHQDDAAPSLAFDPALREAREALRQSQRWTDISTVSPALAVE